MSDKKEWREFTVRYLEPPTGCGMTRTFDPAIKLIQIEAYQAEKQRADRLEKELEKVLGAGRDWMKRALDLDDENQKLKEALENLIHAPDEQCFSEARVRAKEALK